MVEELSQCVAINRTNVGWVIQSKSLCQAQVSFTTKASKLCHAHLHHMVACLTIRRWTMSPRPRVFILKPRPAHESAELVEVNLAISITVGQLPQAIHIGLQDL